MDNQQIYIDSVYSESEKLYRYAVSLMRNDEYARDLIQDVRLKVIENIDKFDGRCLKAWMCKIMYNEFVNQYRKNKKKQNIDIDDVRQLERLAGYDTNDVEFDMMLDNIKNSKVDDVDMLLRVYEGYKYDEIAEFNNIPTGTVKSRIHRSRKLLKDECKF